MTSNSDCADKPSFSASTNASPIAICCTASTMLLHTLAAWPAPAASAVNDLARHRLQHRPRPLQRILVPADHECQSAGGRAGDPAGDRRVKLVEAVRAGQRVYLAGVIDGDRGAVDEQRALSCGGQDVGVAAFDRFAVGQHGENDLGVAHRDGRAVADRDALVRGGCGRGGYRVETPHGVAGGNQVGRHRSAHVAQPQERDRRQLLVLLGSGARPGGLGSADDHPHDFVGPLQDAVHPQIAHDLLQTVLAQIPVAAV